MSRNPRGTNPFDPADERSSAQSSQTASGLTSGRNRAGSTDADDDDRGTREDTPRRYDEPVETSGHRTASGDD